MKSKATQLADYRAIQIPDELLRGTVSEEEIDRQVETLTRSHAQEMDVDTVRDGDSVACRSESASENWSRPLLLVYPGQGMCQALEDACLGAALGEIRTASIDGAELKLTVTRIVRRSPAPADDALARAENIPGVETLTDYRRWYRETTMAERKRQAARQSVSYLSEQIVSQSAYDVDEAEQNEWAADQANRQYDAMVAAGIDPTIPVEGTEFLTEEQARAQMAEEMEAGFAVYLANIALLEQNGIDPEQVYRESVGRLAAEAKMTVETLLERVGENRTRDVAYLQKAAELLTAHVEKLMEA